MKIAVEGCCHGELDKIYETIRFLEDREGLKVDLLICCGDFQAVRNEGDMKCMAVPNKYRQMQTFYKYYSGEKKAPILTIFIGGNHEASNHLQELSYGGWVAPNIYYMGYAGVVRYKGIRIGGLSGIFKFHDYRKGHYEFPPYSPETLRSVYHVRNVDVFKLKQLQMPMDVFLTHDWPQGIYHYGCIQELIRKKKFLQQEVESSTLGSPAAAELLAHLKPSYWFSAHLHVKFAAHMEHEAKGQNGPRTTKFLSLDKCLPHRDFLQVLELAERPGSSENLEYDPEWLAILKATDGLQNVSPSIWLPPEDNGLHAKWDFTVSEADMMEVVKDLGGDLCIPENFSLTVPSYNPSQPQPYTQPFYGINPQTTELCATLGLSDIYAQAGQISQFKQSAKREADDNSGSCEDFNATPTDSSELSASYNPDEITIEDEWNEDADDDDGGTGEKVPSDSVPEKVVVVVADIDNEFSSLPSGSQVHVLPPSSSTQAEVVKSPGSRSLTLPLPTQSTYDSQNLPHLDVQEKCDTEPPKVQEKCDTEPPKVQEKCDTEPPNVQEKCDTEPPKVQEKCDTEPPKVHKRSSDEKDVGKTTTPKIKRRNQTIYIAKDDDGDDEH
ncbi:lariat debranching enzyme isoform X1 [Clupea harengus]|uniref:Lariat debranching enzyme isoform X1 n=1 Tax=Clupea harengus TaxID=7950 RepID=A0A6P8EM33_CLUHA|nr:lariat debranching enzyme isoform X1 [Clupea harengus]